VGAGTAGLAALQTVRKATDDFLLINAGHWGTTCAASGCMPSKALIESANAFHRRRDFAAFGLTGAEGVRADIPSVLRRVRRLRDDFVKGPKKVREELGERAIHGHAQLQGPDCVVVAGREYRARSLILATGSHPVVPAAWEKFGDRILTTDTLFEQADLPRRIAVVGLGAVGAELAQALARLGLDVAGFESGEALAGLNDPEVNARLHSFLDDEIALHTGAEATLEEVDDGIAVSGGGETFTADLVLAAMGRKPNVAGLGLETLGVPLDERGMPEVDPHSLQIADLPVYLVGDANGRLPILHEAADEGYIAGQNAMADAPSRFRRRIRLGIVFVSPEVAQVGSRFTELDPEATAIGAFDFRRQGRARTAERNAGLLRVYADKATGRLQGAEMCAPAAGHLAHLLAQAMQQKATARDLLAMPFYHPVLEEGLRSALRDLARQVWDTPASDLAHCPSLNIEALD
jgi:dihydrolipoamide dehydrogenase